MWLGELVTGIFQVTRILLLFLPYSVKQINEAQMLPQSSQAPKLLGCPKSQDHM